MRINNNDIKGFPYFIDHKSARLWLKEKYGNQLVMNSVGYRNNNKIYLYHYINDKERYLEWKDKKACFEEIDESFY